MADNGPILVTGAAGQLGAVGRTVCGLLLDRGLPVRAMVRREDDRAAALRAVGAEVVVGDLLEPADVHRVVSGCRRVYFGMSVSAGIHNIAERSALDTDRTWLYYSDMYDPIAIALVHAAHRVEARLAEALAGVGLS